MSRTYISTIVLFLTSTLAIFDVKLPFTDEQITEAVFIIISVIAGFKILYERYKKGGVSFAGFTL